MKSKDSARSAFRHTGAAFACLALACAGTATAAVPAAAATQNHTSASSSSAPLSLSSPECQTPYAVGRYTVHLGIPRPIGVQGPIGPGQRLPATRVAATGHTQVTGNIACTQAKVQYSIQRKVCRIWGCDWKTRVKLDPVDLPANGSVPGELSTTCHSGEHSYRMYAKVTWVELVFDNRGRRWAAGLVPNVKYFHGHPEKIVCLAT